MQWMTGDNRMTGNLNYQIVLKEKNVQLLFGSIDFVTQTILTLFPGFKYFHLVYSVARFSFRKDEFFWSYLFVMLTNCFIKPSHHASSMNACQAFPAKHTLYTQCTVVPWQLKKLSWDVGPPQLMEYKVIEKSTRF